MQNLDEFEKLMQKNNNNVKIAQSEHKNHSKTQTPQVNGGSSSPVFRIGKDVFPLFEKLYVTERRFSKELSFTTNDFIKKLLEFYIDKDFGGKDTEEALEFLEYFDSL